MPWSNQGAAQGAAAGSAFGPWGALIGGAAGGLLMGGEQGNAAPPPNLPGVGIPGGVSSPYGGVYVEPTTGRVVYTGGELDYSTLLQGAQNQSLLNELMGVSGGGSVATSTPQSFAIDQQIQKLQDALASQRANVPKIDVSKYGLHESWLNPDGNLKSLQEIMDLAKSNKDPWFAQEYQALGGHYGRGGFDQWLRDAYNRNIKPAYASYAKIADAERGNAAVRSENEQSILRQIAGLQNIKQQITGVQQATQQVSGGRSNSIIDYLNQQPNMQRMQVEKQLADQNAISQQRANRMGMGFGSQNELAQGANRINAELGLNQMAGQNFDQRLKLMDWLRGGQQQAQQQQLQQAGLGLQYTGQGLGVSTGQQALQNQRDAANIGLNVQYQQGQQALAQANQNNLMNSYAGIAQGLGNYYGRTSGTSGTNPQQAWGIGYSQGRQGSIEPAQTNYGNYWNTAPQGKI